MGRESVHFLFLFSEEFQLLISRLNPSQIKLKHNFVSVTGGDGYKWKKVSQKCQFYLEGYEAHVAMEAK